MMITDTNVNTANCGAINNVGSPLATTTITTSSDKSASAVFCPTGSNEGTDTGNNEIDYTNPGLSYGMFLHTNQTGSD